MSKWLLKIRWILLVLALTVPLSSFSGENKNHHSQDAQHASNTEKRGTDADPIAIKILPGPDAETKAAKDEKWRDEKSQEDRVLTRAMIILAGFTALLTVFTGCLWWVTKKLATDASVTAQRQAEDMKMSLKLAEQQMTLAGRQADLAEKQHGLQRWQYLATHRPKLIIRRIWLDEGDGDYFSQGSRCPQIQFNIANIGGSLATIIESNATFAKIEGTFPAIPPYSVDTNTIKCTIREAGQSDPTEILDIEDVEVSRDVRSWRGKTITGGDSSPYYFLGYIQYRDGIDIVRRMAFCRRYNPATKRFVEIDDPEYEYAD
ncbi:MAG: hypothetical protein NTY60_01810 [Proteobacteria bacterium]|nr:hypothetical protein [Pseudomonadota bacterium]